MPDRILGALGLKPNGFILEILWYVGCNSILRIYASPQTASKV